VQTRLTDRLAHGFTELHDDGLLGLIDHKDRVPAQEQGQHKQETAYACPLHFAPP
jgi:hypothetical protein